MHMTYPPTTRRKMESTAFFNFRSKIDSANAAQVTAVGLNNDNNQISNHYKLIKGQFEGIDFPVVFRQKYKGEFTDILGTGWSGLYLISENLKKVLEDNGLIGWKVFSIRLFDLKENEMDGYYGFSIVGHCGPTSLEKSEIIEKQKVPSGPLCQYYKGISFDKWDGSDFFTPDQTYQIFITKKAAEILKKNKITNLEMKKLSEYEISVSTVQMMGG